MTTQWGAPLTGEQMKLLRAAGLPDGTITRYCVWECLVEQFDLSGEGYRLPADHPAYTLLEAGWIDGRNVALWFGGDKAPDDLSEGADVLLANGEVLEYHVHLNWSRNRALVHCSRFIIAYTRKAETEYPPHTDGCFDGQTVAIAKMTREEWDKLRHANLSLEAWAIRNGLIKPEPTREDRFWSTQPNGGAHVTDDVKAWVREALEFE